VCDAGRYGFRWIDDKSRLPEPLHRVGSQGADVSWDRALQEVAASLDAIGPRRSASSRQLRCPTKTCGR
jgi:predicted molibdopterin-dependent oxidoreductase YjgC